MKTEPDVRTTPADVATHTSNGEAAHLPIVLLLAPRGGKLRILPPRAFRRGREWVDLGQVIAHVEADGGPYLIVAPAEGSLGGVLGRDGEPVESGQAVAWLEPA